MKTTALTILTTEIRQIDGLYSLNDLHKAAGGKDKHRPAYFLRNEQTQALIEEIQCAQQRTASKTINGGHNRGTYVCRELIIAYAAWISASFHLKVIQVFLSQSKPSSQKSLPPQQEKSPKRYNYPRYLLEQEYFTSPSRHAPLNISMLGHEKEFSSTLLQLLLELRMDGHNVDAPYDEFIAIREGMIKARRALDEIMHTARCVQADNRLARRCDHEFPPPAHRFPINRSHCPEQRAAVAARLDSGWRMVRG